MNGMNEQYFKQRDRWATAIVWVTAAMVTGIFLWLVGDIVWHGLNHLSWNFIRTPPSDAGRTGGIAPILVSTVLLLSVCLSTSVPLGLLSALYLAEFTQRDSTFIRYVRRSLDILAGVPSIVFGLFGNAFFCQLLGMGFSILAGGLTLSCMVLPILIRSTEQGFRSVPRQHRLSAAALGLSKTSTIRHILLPAAAPGLLVGVVLGVGRALAETAALIFTSGYVDRMPGSLLDSGRSLSIHIYDLSMNVPGGNQAAYASALVLIALLLTINSAAAWMSQRWLTKDWLRQGAGL